MLANQETYNQRGSSSLGVTAWWNKIKAEFKEQTGNETSMTTIRRFVDQQVEDRQLHCKKYPTGSEQRITNDWSIALDRWIKILDMHLENAQDKKEAAEQLERRKKQNVKQKKPLEEGTNKRRTMFSRQNQAPKKNHRKIQNKTKETHLLSRTDSLPPLQLSRLL